MRHHELKTWPEPFEAILSGAKRHEVRVDDRGFAVGDILRLREWDPTPTPFSARGYTEREITCRVTYLSAGGRWGLPGNVCVMTIETGKQVVVQEKCK